MQGARSAETGMYLKYMRISSTAQRRRRSPQQFLRQLLSRKHPGGKIAVASVAHDERDGRVLDTLRDAQRHG